MQFSVLSETKRSQSTAKGRVQHGGLGSTGRHSGSASAEIGGMHMKTWGGLNGGAGRGGLAGEGEVAASMDQAKVLLQEEGTWDEVGGCWPSPATALHESRRALAQGPCRGGKIASFCESERLKCQCDCQEKQGFQVEITRGSSQSKSGRSKTLPFATATCFSLTSPPTGTTPLLQGSVAWPNATPMPHQRRAPPKTWLSCQAPRTRLAARAAKLAPHTCAHTHTFPGWHLFFFLDSTDHPAPP